MLNRHAKRNALDAGMIQLIRSKIEEGAPGSTPGLTSNRSFSLGMGPICSVPSHFRDGKRIGVLFRRRHCLSVSIFLLTG